MRSAVVTLAFALALPASVSVETLAFAQKHAPDTTAQGPAINDPDVKITLADGTEHLCKRQKPQDFLIRSNWFPAGTDKDAAKEGRKLLQKAIDYRTEKYGKFDGFGSAKDNKHPPTYYAKPVHFQGMSALVNEKVGIALACVDKALEASGVAGEYHPKSMGGLRYKNTYRGVEVSNHVYGIAIDIEPHANTCCSCVDPWPNHPLCKKKVTSVYERMAMPRSWVVVFERYGFYWLGHDSLQDTMHFEFLADPDAIVDGQTATSALPAPVKAEKSEKAEKAEKSEKSGKKDGHKAAAKKD